jgi:molybdate transport system substrate-binding protein
VTLGVMLFPGVTVFVEGLLLMRRTPLALVLAVLMLALPVLAACGSSSTTSGGGTTQQNVTLNVFAATSLTDAFTEMGKNFEGKHPGAKVVINFAGSQQLAQQISHGADAEVFASANQKQMDVVVTSGQVAKDSSRVFIKNKLVVFFPKDNPKHVTKLQDLATPGLKLVLADKSVPAGQYALDFLDKASDTTDFGANYKANVLKNVVSYETDVKVVLSKVGLGEADAGIVYTSDATGDSGVQVNHIDIPLALQTIATYPIARLTASKYADIASAFIDDIFTSEGQAILAKYGFLSLNAGVEIVFTQIAVVLAQVFVASPFFVKTAIGAFAAIDRELEQAAAVDGASPFAVFRRITLPLSANALFGGAVMTWARAGGVWRDDHLRRQLPWPHADDAAGDLHRLRDRSACCVDTGRAAARHLVRRLTPRESRLAPARRDTSLSFCSFRACSSP